LVGLALLGGLLACLVVDGLGRSLVDRRLLQLTINLELVRTNLAIKHGRRVAGIAPRHNP